MFQFLKNVNNWVFFLSFEIIDSKKGGKPTLRMAGDRKAGPVVSDNGNFILDVDFGVIEDAKGLNEKLLQIAGVVETGLFIGMAEKAFFGQEDGSVIVW